MPGFNGTGPQGAGSMTGRGLGLCGGGQAYGRGMGRGMGRGFGQGKGRMFGFGLRRATKTDDVRDTKNYIQDLEAELKDAQEYLKTFGRDK